MGKLVDGVWHDVWYETKSNDGAFVRADAKFRNWVTPDGAPGPSGDGGFKAEADRYHLYVSFACPWAHRTLMFRKLKGLEDMISVSVVDPDMLSEALPLTETEMTRIGEDFLITGYLTDVVLVRSVIID